MTKSAGRPLTPGPSPSAGRGGERRESDALTDAHPPSPLPWRERGGKRRETDAATDVHPSEPSPLEGEGGGAAAG